LVFNKRKNKAIERKRNLMTYYNPDSNIAEQFRTIKTNIHFAANDKPIRTLLITSPSDGEGKTTTSANLAVSMAQQKEKVLLIDGNLRTPTIHFTFNVANTKGLTTVLNGLTTLEDTIYRTDIGRLDILTSGPVPIFPTELLGSQGMEELLINTLQQYDIVIIDSPSVLEVADTKLLANQCDGVVLVISRSKTGIREATETKKVLEYANSKIVGVILNEN
jgi:capsular exopolysaccharide synthesis family protein